MLLNYAKHSPNTKSNRRIGGLMPFETEYSNFPKTKIKLHKYKNIDDTIKSAIDQINSKRAQGDYDQAAELIKSSPEDLSQYIIDATTFRTLEEEIYNTQIYAKQKQQFIYFDKGEPDALYSDVWISDSGMTPKPESPVEETEIIHTYTKSCALSDGIWEGAILSEENYVHLCDKSTTSSWTYYHNLGIDVDKITSISGNISSNNKYDLAIETFRELDSFSRNQSYSQYMSLFTVCGISNNDTAFNGNIYNPKLGYVYVNTLFTNTPEYDSEINPACFLKLYVYPDYVKFEFTAENPVSRLNIYRMYINMRSTAPAFSFSFTYTD